MAKSSVFKKIGSPTRSRIAAAALNGFLVRYSGEVGERALESLANEAEMTTEDFLSRLAVAQADNLIHELGKAFVEYE